MWIRAYIFPVCSAKKKIKKNVYERVKIQQCSNVNASMYLLGERKLSPVTLSFKSNGNEVILFKFVGSTPLVPRQTIKK